MGRIKEFRREKSRRHIVGFAAFRKAFLKHFQEELKHHEGPNASDLQDIYHEYVESNMTLDEFLERGDEFGKKKTS